MLLTPQILASAVILTLSAACLIACGQPGALYLPTEPIAAQRATLPQSLIPGSPAPAAAPAASASAPVKP